MATKTKSSTKPSRPRAKLPAAKQKAAAPKTAATASRKAKRKKLPGTRKAAEPGFIKTVKDGVHSAMESVGEFVQKITSAKSRKSSK